MIFFLNLYRLRESQKTQFDKKCCTRYIRKLYIHAAIYDDQTLILFVFYYRHIFLPTFRNKSQSLVNKIKTYVLIFIYFKNLSVFYFYKLQKNLNHSSTIPYTG